MGDFSQDSVVKALVEILRSKGIITKEELNEKIILIRNEKNNQNELVSRKKSEISSLEEAEKALILKTLHDLQGNKSAAARRLKITRKTLQNKLKKYDRTNEQQLYL